jgi:hypothetical protein
MDAQLEYFRTRKVHVCMSYALDTQEQEVQSKATNVVPDDFIGAGGIILQPEM